MSGIVDSASLDRARLERARALYRIGYHDDFDLHDAHDGTRHLCHLIDVRSGVPNWDQVNQPPPIRALHFLNWRS